MPSDHPTVAQKGVGMGENMKSWPGMDPGVSQHRDLAAELAMLAGFVCIVAIWLGRLLQNQRHPSTTPSGANVLQTSLRPRPANQSRQSQWSPSQQEAGKCPLAYSATDTSLNGVLTLNGAHCDPIVAPSHNGGMFHTSFTEGFSEKRNPSKDMRYANNEGAGLPLNAAGSRSAPMFRSAPNLYARDSQASKPAQVSSGSRYFAELVRRQGGKIPVTPPGLITPLTTKTQRPFTPSTPCTPGPMVPSARLRAGSRFSEQAESDGPRPVVKHSMCAKFTKRMEDGGGRGKQVDTVGGSGEGRRHSRSEGSATLFASERVLSWDCSRGEQGWDWRN